MRLIRDIIEYKSPGDGKEQGQGIGKNSNKHEEQTAAYRSSNASSTRRRITSGSLQAIDAAPARSNDLDLAASCRLGARDRPRLRSASLAVRSAGLVALRRDIGDARGVSRTFRDLVSLASAEARSMTSELLPVTQQRGQSSPGIALPCRHLSPPP